VRITPVHMNGSESINMASAKFRSALSSVSVSNLTVRSLGQSRYSKGDHCRSKPNLASAQSSVNLMRINTMPVTRYGTRSITRFQVHSIEKEGRMVIPLEQHGCSRLGCK